MLCVGARDEPTMHNMKAVKPNYFWLAKNAGRRLAARSIMLEVIRAFLFVARA